MNVRPWGDGKATRVNEDAIEATFPVDDDMIRMGYKMTSAEVDESGYFLTVRWEKPSGS